MSKRRGTTMKAMAILPFTALLATGCERSEAPEEPVAPDAEQERMVPQQREMPQQQPQTGESPFGQPPEEEEERRPGGSAGPGGY